MTLPADFPPSPFVGQMYTTPAGVTYQWDGAAWTVGFYDSPTQQLLTLDDLLDQIRTLLQDTDVSSGQYRYSSDSIVTAINQGMSEMFRIRPDLFLAMNYVTPRFHITNPSAEIGIEDQYIPPLVYYAVGLVQARDDEQTQDARAVVFLKVFQAALVSGAVIPA